MRFFRRPINTSYPTDYDQKDMYGRMWRYYGYDPSILGGGDLHLVNPTTQQLGDVATMYTVKEAIAQFQEIPSLQGYEQWERVSEGL